MKNKLLKTVGIFLLLVPFRLTISILLIKLFTFTATVNGEDVPLEILSASVLISKSCYDLALGIWLSIMLGNIYYSLAKTDELDYYGKAKLDDWYVGAIMFTVLLIAGFIGLDLYLTNELFWHFNK